MYFLDTNTCIYFLNGRSKAVAERIYKTNPKEICIPAIVRAELVYGAYKSNRTDEVLQKLNTFFSNFSDEAFSSAAMYTYAQIRSELEAKGQMIGPNDCLIAATVLQAGGTLVTNNEKEFSRVRGLKVENWAHE